MPRFFIPPHNAYRDGSPIAQGESLFLFGEDARHIAKSLRMQPGEKLTLCDGAGIDYDCELAAITPDHVETRLLQMHPSENEPTVRIRLYQALPKGDKLDLIVQKAVELGVFEIVPVLSDRCISRPDAKNMSKKSVRLQKIALEAAKQSGRGIVPQILPLQTYSQAISGMKSMETAILLYELATRPLSSQLAAKPNDIAIMVGCEGGFSTEEAAFAQTEGIMCASLGKRILRCETAPLCALSAILFAYGEF